MTCHVTSRPKRIYALQIVPRRTCKYRSTRRDIGNIDSFRRDGLNAGAFIIEPSPRLDGGLLLACYVPKRKLILTTSSTYWEVFCPPKYRFTHQVWKWNRTILHARFRERRLSRIASAWEFAARSRLFSPVSLIESNWIFFLPTIREYPWIL